MNRHVSRTLLAPGTAALTGHSLPIFLDVSVPPICKLVFLEAGGKEHAQAALLVNSRRSEEVQTSRTKVIMDLRRGSRTMFVGVAGGAVQW